MDSKFFNQINPLGIGMRPEPKTLEQMNISVMRAKEQDWEDVKNIRCESVDFSAYELGLVDEKRKMNAKNRTVDEWKKDIREQLIFLSKCGNKPIGIAKGIKMDGQSWSLTWVYVNKDFQKKQVGVSVAEIMLKKLIEEIKNEKGNDIGLWVRNSNTNAIKLYENLGFKKFDPIKYSGQISNLISDLPDLLKGCRVMELYLNKK